MVIHLSPYFIPQFQRHASNILQRLTDSSHGDRPHPVVVRLCHCSVCCLFVSSDLLLCTYIASASSDVINININI